MNIKILWIAVTLMVVSGAVSYVAMKPKEPLVNPLLHAPLAQLNVWVPKPCGNALFYTHNMDMDGQKDCAKQIIANVKRDTGVTLTTPDVMNAEVAGYWIHKQRFGQ